MAASVLTRPTFTLADRLRIQQERSRDRDYKTLGRLTAVEFEGQRNIKGLSQGHADQSDFSRKQTQLWCSITLDWLSHKNAPIIAISRDHQDLLLPLGMRPLPPIPDPRWRPTNSATAHGVSGGWGQDSGQDHRSPGARLRRVPSDHRITGDARRWLRAHSRGCRSCRRHTHGVSDR